MRIAGPDERFDTGDDIVSIPETINAGQSGRLAGMLASAGSMNFRCDFHPTVMTGRLTVK